MTRSVTTLIAFFVFSFSFLVSLVTKAQENAPFKFSGGFFLGVVGSQVDGDKHYGFNQGGFTAGATAQYPISRKFLAALEINFTQKGAQSKQVIATSGQSPNYFDLRVNYVDIPLMVKFYDRKVFGLGLGAQYSRVVGTPKQYTDPLRYPPFTGLDNYTNGDISGIAEGSYYFSPELQLNIRYCYGWTPMGYSKYSDYEDFACYNNLIMVRLGYIFGQAFDDKKPKDKKEKAPRKPYLEDAE